MTRPAKKPAYVVVQRCPVPRPLAPVLTEILNASGAQLQSCYRGSDAAALLHTLGKHSQLELYQGWVNRLPGYNPANPPGRSTHELRNDGSAYKQWRTGQRLPWWAVGIDVDDEHVDDFIREAGKRGYKVAVTYPGSRSEYHHLNFRKPPLHVRVKAQAKAAWHLVRPS